MSENSREPYRSHFLLGTVCAALGALLWPAFQAGYVSYPVAAHGQLMLLGFLLSFVAGFLMTAAPRMSGAPQASRSETRIAIALACLSVTAAIASWPVLCRLFAAAQILVLGRFLFSRFRRRKQNPPLGFVFVPVGLLWGLFGLIIPLFSQHEASLVLARIGLQEGLLLNLVTGLGSRLVPFLTRTQNIDPREMHSTKRGPTVAILFILNMSLALEAWYSEPWVWGLRAFSLLAAGIFLFSLFKRAQQATVLGAGIKLSILAIFGGYAAIAVFPGSRLALLHIVFIGGFGLLTLMVATRVLLSHGGHSILPEVRSRTLLACVILVIASAFFRAGSWWTAAAVLWILAVLFWGARLARAGVRP